MKDSETSSNTIETLYLSFIQHNTNQFHNLQIKLHYI